MASAGLICPAVPPPANNTFIFSHLHFNKTRQSGTAHCFTMAECLEIFSIIPIWSSCIINAVPPIVYYLMIQISVTASTPLPMLFNVNKPASYILPLVCMALGPTANYAMWIRRYMVDELNRDYIKLARAKGMPNNAIMRRHVMRNAFIPLAQYLPSTILFTISGSIYVEALFSIPGMGGLLISAIQKQDNPVVQAVVLLYAVMGVFGLLLGDIAMAVCDPRISLYKKGGSR